MIKNIITILSILFLSQLGFATTSKEKIVAKVNGQAIYEADIRNRITQYLEVNEGLEDSLNYDKIEPGIKEEIIKNIILGDLIIKQAKQAKINDTLEYKQAVKLAENQFMQKLYLEKLVKEALTDAKIQARYNQIAEEYKHKEEYKVSHILVATEKEAQDIKQKLNKGEKFTNLAKEYSKDNNKEDGGNIGYFSKGQMVEPFEQEVFKMKIGEISNPVKTDFGYHIIMLEDKRQAQMPTFAELKPKIVEEITGQFVQKYITDLKNQNKVEFF